MATSDTDDKVNSTTTDSTNEDKTPSKVATDETKNETTDVRDTETGLTAAQSALKNANLPDVSTSRYDTFYIDVRVLLEGVQVPHSGCSVSYGIQGAPTATITLPAANFLRYLPGSTKVLILFRDYFCKQSDKESEPKYRVIFDGELSSTSYTITPSGANLVISAMHPTGYLDLMKIATFPISATGKEDLASVKLGQVALPTTTNGNIQYVNFLKELLNREQGHIKSMSDIVFLLLWIYLKAYGAEANNYTVAKWYNWHLGEGKGAFKLLHRVYGVTKGDSGPMGVNLKDFITDLHVDSLQDIVTSNGSWGYQYSGDVNEDDPILSVETNYKVTSVQQAPSDGKYSKILRDAANSVTGQSIYGPADNPGANCALTVSRIINTAFAGKPAESIPLTSGNMYPAVASFVKIAQDNNLLVSGTSVASYKPHTGDLMVFWYKIAGDDINNRRRNYNHIVMYDCNGPNGNPWVWEGSGSKYVIAHRDVVESGSVSDFPYSDVQFYIRLSNYDCDDPDNGYIKTGKKTTNNTHSWSRKVETVPPLTDDQANDEKPSTEGDSSK